MPRTEQEIIKELCSKVYKIGFNDGESLYLYKDYKYDRRYYDEGSQDKRISVEINKKCKRIIKVKTIYDAWELVEEQWLMNLTKREQALIDELKNCWGWT